MSGFTPGPWVIRPEPSMGGGIVLMRDESDTIGYHIGEVWTVSGSPQNEANARLIAAAPNGYAANVAMLAALDEAFGIKATWDDERIYDELPSSGIARAYFMARAAIAAATGEPA